MTTNNRYSFVAAGEILIDFISREPSTSLRDSTSFGKFFGGAPANVAANMKNLGISSTIVSKVGKDGLGTFLIDFLKNIGIPADYVKRDETHPTSLVVVTSKQTPPEFIAYRQADTRLASSDIPDELLKNCDIFHTTAHGIARKPTQDAVLDAFRRTKAFGKWTSFDPNYSESFWPDRDEAMEVMRKFFACTTFCKPSLDDAERMFGRKSEDAYIDLFHEWGVQYVTLSLGARGAIFSSRDGTRKAYPAIHTPDIVDPTGTGDAFIAGFFAAYLKTGDFDKAMSVGIKTATFALKHMGAVSPLPNVEDFF